jgi:ubiquinone/menaquinone biosynthesis C-methylase UbiE
MTDTTAETKAQQARARKRGVAQFFDRGADQYDTIGNFFTPMALELVRAAGVAPGEHVLDVGCGRGAATFAAADAVGPAGRVVGIDLASRMVALTAAEARERRLEQVTVVQGDAEEPSFPAASFDVVLAALVLFFLPDPAAALRRYAGLLRPGGRLGFTTFARNDAHFEAAMKAVGSYIPTPPPERDDRQGPFGSPEGIGALVGAAGFEPPQISEHEFVTRFADPDEWLAWVWSHGGRFTMEQVPEDRRVEAEEAGKAAIAAARTAEGDYAITTTIRITVARPG